MVERPIAGPYDVVVRVAAVGICGSDLTLFSSGVLPDNYIMGHEIAGVVEESGGAVTRFRKGARVVVRPNGCGMCAMCRREIPHLCDAKLAVGTGSLQGGFSEYVRVPERMLMDVPGDVTLRDAALVDTIAVGCHGISRVSFAPGEDGVIFGAGPIGLATLLVLRASGARRIGVVEVNETRQRFTREFGADVVVSPRDSDYRQRLNETFSGTGPDVALECAGRVDAMKDALDTVRPGGRVALVGITFESLTILPISLTMREVSIFPTFSTRWADNEAALDFIRRSREEARGLVSDIIGIDELPHVFGELLAGALKKKVLAEFFEG